MNSSALSLDKKNFESASHAVIFQPSVYIQHSRSTAPAAVMLYTPMTGFKKLPFCFETLKFLSFSSPIQTLTIS